ncbi:MAG TPA: acyl-CoA desaturase, partial [Elainellaceae cyanobacterium]
MTTASLTKLPRDWAVIVIMIVIHAGALFALLPSNFSWAAVGLAVFLHWVTG